MNIIFSLVYPGIDIVSSTSTSSGTGSGRGPRFCKSDFKNAFRHCCQSPLDVPLKCSGGVCLSSSATPLSAVKKRFVFVSIDYPFDMFESETRFLRENGFLN